jgi:aspartate racemase
MTKLVGLIGGMSWKTTALYYQAINNHVRSTLGGIHSANLLIRSVDYDKIARCVSVGDTATMTKIVCESGHQLKAGGAQALALCANVAHKAADDLVKSTALPVLHIVDFAGREIVRHGFKKVGLLATKAVMEEEFYKSRLNDRYGLEVVVPDDTAFRDRADGQIFEEMSKAIIPDHVKRSWERECHKLVDDHHVDCVVLACTELRLVLGTEDARVPMFDTTLLHAQGIAEWALGKE